MKKLKFYFILLNITFFSSAYAGTLELAAVHGQLINRSPVILNNARLHARISPFIHGGMDSHGGFYGDFCSDENNVILDAKIDSAGQYDFAATKVVNPSGKQFCIDVTLYSDDHSVDARVEKPIYIVSNSDWRSRVSQYYLDFGFQPQEESFKVQVPNGLTIQQYVARVVDGLPYANLQNYAWELTLEYHYQSLSAEVFPTRGDLFSAVAEVPFGNAIANSTTHADYTSFTVSGVDVKDPWSNLMLSSNKNYVPVSRFEAGFEYRIELNLWEKSTGMRWEYFDTMPDPLSYLKPGFEGELFLDRSWIKIPGIDHLQNIVIELNPSIEQVRHTGCCGIRGLWMHGSL